MNSSQYFSIIRIGHQICPPNYNVGPVKRSHYSIHFVVRGSGLLTTSKGSSSISAPCAFLIKPDTSIQYSSSAEDPWEYYWIAFSEQARDEFEYLFPTFNATQLCAFKSSENLIECLNSAISYYKSSVVNPLILKSYFYMIISYLEPDTALLKNYTYPPILLHAKQYIENNFCYPIDINDICRELNLNRTYLFKLFKRHLNTSPKQYLTSCRIHHAKAMIISGNCTLTEVAFSCGFKDYCIFSKCFHNTTGISPSKYAATK